MPMSSAYRKALLDDPEVADHLARQPEPKGAAGPSLEEFTPEVSALYTLGDLLMAAIAELQRNRGAKPPQVRPLPRPVTGVHRARRRIEVQRADALMDEFKAAQRRWSETRGGERDAGSQ